jgi:hypothetical protein
VLDVIPQISCHMTQPIHATNCKSDTILDRQIKAPTPEKRAGHGMTLKREQFGKKHNSALVKLELQWYRCDNIPHIQRYNLQITPQ